MNYLQYKLNELLGEIEFIINTEYDCYERERVLEFLNDIRVLLGVKEGE